MTTCAPDQSAVYGPPVTRPSRTGCDNVRHRNVRATLCRALWSAVVRTLNGSKLPYCVLGTAADAPGLTNSDVDFVVRPGDYPLVPHLLASAAASVGGQPVQAIDHETTATYFVLARQQGEIVAFLHPDCTTDYRRQRRLWMSSEELLRGRRRAPGGYFRPAPDVEFKYYLIKQVLKQTLSDAQWQKLVALYEASPLPHDALSLWRRSTAAQIEQAILNHDCDGFKELLARCKDELTNTSPQECTLARSEYFILDSARVVTRITQPTGLFVQISNGEPEERTALAGQLAKTVAPAFRRSSVVASRNPAKVLRALVESTLVVSPDEVIPFRTLYGGVDIHWQSALTPGENFDHAVAAVLSHLSQRTARRLELQPFPWQQFGPGSLTHTTVF